MIAFAMAGEDEGMVVMRDDRTSAARPELPFEEVMVERVSDNVTSCSFMLCLSGRVRKRDMLDSGDPAVVMEMMYGTAEP